MHFHACGDACNRLLQFKEQQLLTRLGDVIPVWRVKLILCLKDLLKEFGVVFIIERGISTEPNGEQGKREVTTGPTSVQKVRRREEEGETLT